jgi:hypothetical protein
MVSKKAFSRATLIPAIGAGVLLATLATPGQAQLVIQGFNRSDQTDVTGPAVTSGDQAAGMFGEPGTIQSWICPVAWGVRSTSDAVVAQLAGGRLEGALHTAGSLEGQEMLLQLLLGAAGARDAERRIAGALGEGEERRAQAASRDLARRLNGLLGATGRLDPANPGPIAASRLGRAVAAYNEVVERSSPQFLAAPPQEFVAIHAVLNRLVLAAIENEGRPTDVSQVDERGLACAAPLAPVVAPPAGTPPAETPPPVERAIEICVATESGFRNIAAVYRPGTGDTLVFVGGERRAFSEVHTGAVYAQSELWFVGREPVMHEGREYQPFGLPRVVQPGELIARGTYQGVPVFVQPNERTPADVLYFAVRTGCEVQPYRAVERIRVRG